MNRSRKFSLVMLALAAFSMAPAGCYSRVVKTSGIGADATEVKPEYRSNTAADRAVDSIFSSPKSSSNAPHWADPNGPPPTSR